MSVMAESTTGLDAAGRQAMQRAARASVAVALTLIAAKLVAWLSSGSMAMLGSLMDSGLDLIASLVTLFAVGHAIAPADEDHRFGHGKAEGLAALFQAAIITGSAVFLLLEAIGRLIEPQEVEKVPLGIAVSILGIVLSLILVLYQRHVVKRTGSLAISADSLHYSGDLLLNASVIIALVMSGFWGISLADPIAAIAIAGFLGWNAFGLARSAVDMLMDKEWPEEDRQRIIGIILENSQVVEVHELRTRSSGTDAFIQFHISLRPDMSIAEAHTISDEIEAVLGEQYPQAEIFIHIDPVGLVEHGQQKGY